MLTVEAITEIRKIMEAGQSTEILAPPLEAGVYYTHLRGAGVQPLKKHVVPLGARRYLVSSVEDLVAAIKLFGKSAPSAETWFVAVGCSSVTAVANDPAEDPRDRHEVRFCLSKSDPFIEIEKLAVDRASLKPMDLLTFIRFLRVELVDAVPPGFLQSIREVRYSSTSRSNASVHTGVESLGQEVLRQATLSGDSDEGGPRTACNIPDEVTMNVNVYDELLGESYDLPVRCIVDVRFGEAGPEFSLIPVAGELSCAQRDTVVLLKIEVEAVLKNANMTDVAVICGSVNASLACPGYAAVDQPRVC